MPWVMGSAVVTVYGQRIDTAYSSGAHKKAPTEIHSKLYWYSRHLGTQAQAQVVGVLAALSWCYQALHI
jgi:hypothetical protein